MKVETLFLPWEELELLDHNARFMRHEQFQQLVENIRRDGCLSSCPFAMWNPATGKWKVLSGNHRCKAGKAAGLPGATFVVTRDALSHGEQVAIQLSHNAIAGEDDLAILKDLYESIPDLDLKKACGLDDKTLGLLAEITAEGKPSAALEWTNITLAFLPDEAQDIKRVFAEVEAASKGEVLAARFKDYDEFMDALGEAGVAGQVKNSATALRIMLDVFGASLPDLVQLYAEQDGQAGKGTKKQAPLSSVFGTRTVDAHSAMILNRAIERALEQDKTGNLTRTGALRQMAELYLAQGS